MDARFVLVEIGKLTSSVDRLVTDVGKLSTTVQELKSNVAFVKGAAWVLGGLMVLCTTILGFILAGKLKISLG